MKNKKRICLKPPLAKLDPHQKSKKFEMTFIIWRAEDSFKNYCCSKQE